MQRPRPPAARTRKSQGDAVSRSTVTEREVIVQSAGVELAGSLTLPDPAAGLVLFAHGSGSSRFSRRNRYVASVLVGPGLATLLFDLLTAARSRSMRWTGRCVSTFPCSAGA